MIFRLFLQPSSVLSPFGLSSCLPNLGFRRKMSTCNLSDQRVESYEEFNSLVNTLNQCPDKSIYLLFRGSSDSGGESWCPDCVRAEPVVREVHNSLEKKSRVLIQISVGGREVWKDPRNPFRTDPRISISVIPTLVKWKGGRLVGDGDCANKSVLQKFFSS